VKVDSPHRRLVERRSAGDQADENSRESVTRARRRETDISFGILKDLAVGGRNDRLGALENDNGV
jgi:hypothetical protein